MQWELKRRNRFAKENVGNSWEKVIFSDIINVSLVFFNDRFFIVDSKPKIHFFII